MKNPDCQAAVTIVITVRRTAISDFSCDGRFDAQNRLISLNGAHLPTALGSGTTSPPIRWPPASAARTVGMARENEPLAPVRDASTRIHWVMMVMSLMPLESALSRDRDPRHRLAFSPENHMELSRRGQWPTGRAQSGPCSRPDRLERPGPWRPPADQTSNSDQTALRGTRGILV